MSTAPIKIGDYVKIKNYTHFTGQIGQVLKIDIMESEALVSIKSKYGKQACSPKSIPLVYLDVVEKPDYDTARKNKKLNPSLNGISSKFRDAKPGSYFYETVAARGNGLINEMPKILEFIKVFQDESGKNKVLFVDISRAHGTGMIVVDADDALGRYPALTNARLREMSERVLQLKAEIKMLDHILAPFS